MHCAIKDKPKWMFFIEIMHKQIKTGSVVSLQPKRGKNILWWLLYCQIWLAYWTQK